MAPAVADERSSVRKDLLYELLIANRNLFLLFITIVV